MDLHAALAANSDRFAAVLADVAADTPVPSCDGWTALDLAWHLTEVQWEWGTVVLAGATEPADPADRPARPGDMAGTLALFATQSARLRDALASADPSVPLWTWHQDHDDLAWVVRRQAHEAIVHRADAELTAGLTPTVDPLLGTDGTDELLQMFVTGVPAWATFTADGTDVTIEASDTGHAWGLDLGVMTGTSPNTGNVYEGEDALAAAMLEPARRDATMTLRGPAGALDLWLWGRGPIDAIEVTGDASMVDRLRALIADATQ